MSKQSNELLIHFTKKHDIFSKEDKIRAEVVRGRIHVSKLLLTVHFKNDKVPLSLSGKERSDDGCWTIPLCRGENQEEDSIEKIVFECPLSDNEE